MEDSVEEVDAVEPGPVVEAVAAAAAAAEECRQEYSRMERIGGKDVRSGDVERDALRREGEEGREGLV